MKPTIIVAYLLVVAACAHPQPIALVDQHENPYSHWMPAGPDDYRGPCPGLNTLANHGFLPRDGKNLTREVVIHGLHAGMGFNESLADIMFTQALPANPQENATFFTLDMLNRHNVLEHDASMSRSDAYFGNNHVFNETVFNQTRVYWTGPTLDRNMLANGKVARMVQSRATNPTYRFTSTTEAFSLEEVLAPVVVFGDKEAVTVNKSYVDFFFENERFPIHLGWSKPAEPIILEDITRLSSIFANASTILTDDSTASLKRANLHG